MPKFQISVLFLALVLGCAHAKPEVICTLENPTTGERVQMFKEIPYKVPANYDEAKHIASWKADQATKGFTHEIK
jgi:hypothetical protein